MLPFGIGDFCVHFTTLKIHCMEKGSKILAWHQAPAAATCSHVAGRLEAETALVTNYNSF